MDLELETTEVNVELGQNNIEINLEGGARGLKGDTGSVGPTGPQGIPGSPGEKGDSGVWVGEEEPTGDYNVWINPEGTPGTVAKEIYSYEEELTNKVWIDGNNVEHPVYRLVIDIDFDDLEETTFIFVKNSGQNDLEYLTGYYLPDFTLNTEKLISTFAYGILDYASPSNVRVPLSLCPICYENEIGFLDDYSSTPITNFKKIEVTLEYTKPTLND